MSDKCTCTPCPDCDGHGTVWWTFGYKEYLGNHRCDDLDEQETCETCLGRGTEDKCDYCIEQEELEMMGSQP